MQARRPYPCLSAHPSTLLRLVIQRGSFDELPHSVAHALRKAVHWHAATPRGNSHAPVLALAAEAPRMERLFDQMAYFLDAEDAPANSSHCRQRSGTKRVHQHER